MNFVCENSQTWFSAETFDAPLAVLFTLWKPYLPQSELPQKIEFDYFWGTDMFNCRTKEEKLECVK
jgi:hypothetical protein